MFECGRNFQNNAEITFTVSLEHLSKPKTPTHFECETTPMDLDEIREKGSGFLNANIYKIKTTTNSQGQIELVGKYLNLWKKKQNFTSCLYAHWLVHC